MPGLLSECERLFDTSNLYEVLRIDTLASFAEVKKGYYKISLLVHPDRAELNDKELAKEKFQTLGKVYKILSDKEKRAIYDEDGSVDDESFNGEEERDWTAYWRRLFRKVTVEDIRKFEANYRGSSEEKEDVRRAYLQSCGDMDKVLGSVMCSSVEDVERYRQIMLHMLERDKTLPKHDGFFNETAAKQRNRKRKAEKEAKEAEDEKKKRSKSAKGSDEGGDDLAQLTLAIREKRAQENDDFLDRLAQKYGKTQAKGGKSSKKENVKDSSKGKKKSSSGSPVKKTKKKSS